MWCANRLNGAAEHVFELAQNTAAESQRHAGLIANGAGVSSSHGRYAVVSSTSRCRFSPVAISPFNSLGTNSSYSARGNSSSVPTTAWRSIGSITDLSNDFEVASALAKRPLTVYSMLLDSGVSLVMCTDRRRHTSSRSFGGHPGAAPSLSFGTVLIDVLTPPWRASVERRSSTETRISTLSW